MSRQKAKSSQSKKQFPDRLHLDALLVYVEADPFAWMFSRRSQLGLYYLAQHAVDVGYQVRVDNLSANDHLVRRLSRILREHSCHILGLYVDQDNLWDLRRVLPALKEGQPDLDIILGGPQVTGEPELTLDRLPQATCGVIGEGEETFVELLSFPSLTQEHIKTCAGLAIRIGERVVRTPPRQPIEPLDRLSIPQRKELSLDAKYPFEPMMIAGRGCTGRCAFCYEGGKVRSGKRLRLHSAQHCIEEFAYIAEQLGRGYVCILDDTFVADTKRLRKFCKELIARYDGKFKWFCEARVDTLTRYPNLLPLMIQAGLIRLQVGGESGSQRILDIYRKGTTLEQMYTVVESARTHKLLSLYVNFIIGGAYETNDSYRLTRDFALELLRLAPGCVSVGSSFYTPYPGTPMYENPRAFGIEIVDEEGVTGMGDKHAFCRTKQLSRFDILALGNEFRESVEQTMGDLCKQLLFDVMERNFRAYFEYDISSEWYEVLSENMVLYSYFKSIFRAGAKRFAEVAAHDFSNAYPIRNVDLVASKQGKYLIRLPRDVVRELDALESVILELSAGKLSFDDIVKIANSRVPGLAPATLREAIIERYADFDSEFLIVWKTNTL